MKTYFEKGDKIIYQYTHRCGKSFWEIGKEAIFIRKVKIKPFDNSWSNPKVIIQVNGNKSTSTVNLSEIRHRN